MNKDYSTEGIFLLMNISLKDTDIRVKYLNRDILIIVKELNK